ncbi:MAG: hypothetical protein AB2556_23380, partial [Candidatus Thiodiazotropha sp.]
NGHACPKDLHFPQSREVHIYEGDVWQAIREATRSEPLAVWLLGGQNSQQRQLFVNQFVLQDGRTNRTQETHKRIQAICSKLGCPELTDRAFGENHIASIMAKERKGLDANPGRPPPGHSEGLCGARPRRLWNSMGYDTREVISIDMKACYSTSFQGMGEAKPYFEQFGHPAHRMTRVAINGPLLEDIRTGFAEVQGLEFDPSCYPVIPAWLGRHFANNTGGWALTQLLAYLIETGLLKSLTIKEAIISFDKQSEI